MKKLLCFVHVGKCGGSTIWNLLNTSSSIASRYKSIEEIHVNGAKIKSNCDYLVCLRNPVDRAISAFEWRKKLVLIDAHVDQVDRFVGEKSVLASYKTLENLACSLYKKDNRLCQKTARDFALIHHLRESISFYIRPLLPVLSSGNVLGVICQESLAEDCQRILGVDATTVNERKNNAKQQSFSDLSDQAIRNLKRFLADDYQCIVSLWSLGLLDDKQFAGLMFKE